jgi:hypothetical protein
LHRTNVTAVDASDPADASAAVDTQGRELCHFDVYEEAGSGGVTSISVQLLCWNTRLSKWMRGDSRTLTSLPAQVTADVQAAKVYLKVTALSGTTPKVGIDYSLS